MKFITFSGWRSHHAIIR